MKEKTFILEGNNVTKLDVNNYAVNVYQGKNSTISLNAENIKNGESYNSILTNNSHLIKVVADYDSTKIDINSNNLSSIIVNVNKDYIVTGKNETVDVELKVLLDEAYFLYNSNRSLWT